MKKIFTILSFALLIPILAYSNKVIGLIGKKGVQYQFNEEKLKTFLIRHAGFNSVSSISILEKDGLYALHMLGYDKDNKKILVVKELKKENNKLIITEKSDNTYLLSKHFCTGLKVQDNNYKLAGVTAIKCECTDPYSDNLYNQTFTTEVGFDYRNFYNAFSS